MKQQTNVVTNAAGTQGRATIKSLVPLRYRIRALIRSSNSSEAEAPMEMGVEIVVGNFENIKSLGHAIDGTSAIFLNVSPFVKDPEAETRREQIILSQAASAEKMAPRDNRPVIEVVGIIAGTG